MKITCPKCKIKLVFPDEKLKPGQTRIKCGKCGAVLVFKRKPAEEAPETPPEDQSVVDESQTPVQQTSMADTEASRVEPENEVKSMPGDLPAPDDAHAEDVKPAEAGMPAPQAQENKAGSNKTVSMAAATKKHSPTPPAETPNNRSTGKVRLLLAAGGVLIVALALFFIFRSGPGTPKEQAAQRAPVAETPGGQTPPQTSSVEGTSQAGQSAETVQATASAPPPPASGPPYYDMTEEKAVEIVKRSDVLFKRTPVDSIVNKWAGDNAARFKIVGWQSKKVDEQKYFVSYTAMEGERTVGFYFEVDAQSGAIKDIGRDPELQKQYNIQYNR